MLEDLETTSYISGESGLNEDNLGLNALCSVLVSSSPTQQCTLSGLVGCAGRTQS